MKKISKSFPAIFQSPKTGKPLELFDNPIRLENETEVYSSKSDVLIFLENNNPDYEGVYTGQTMYVPRKESLPYTFPLWLMFNGFVWEVRKQFSPGALICELGCAGGVNYFGQRYNMIGLDYSYQSLLNIANYELRIQANAIKLPFKDSSLDGIISSFFWEHISPEDKAVMLKEFYRVLKPSGKVAMLYDIETNNTLINLLKKDDPQKYEDLFLKHDFHIGYESLEANKKKFEEAGFGVTKHVGLERTIFQSSAVYTKMANIKSWYGKYAKFLHRLTSTRITENLNKLWLRTLDLTIGKMLSPSKSRIAISILEKRTPT